MKKIIWYGSLLNIESARKSCEAHNFSYGYIKNFKRVFNKRWFHPYDRYYLDNTSMLNIVYEEWRDLLVSYFDVSDEDFKNIRRREWDYKEVSIDIYDDVGEKQDTWIVFISKEQSIFEWLQVSLIHNNFLPDERYLDICLTSFWKNKELLDEFLCSTFLGCGKLTLWEYIKNK